MIGSNITFHLNDRQQKALTNYAERKGVSQPTTTGILSMLIAKLDEYKMLEPKPENNGEIS